MAVEIKGFELEVRTTGIVHSSEERVLFTLENEQGNPKNRVLRFFTHLGKPQREKTNDYLYFCANGATQRISFVWGSDPQKPLGWSGRLFIPESFKAD